MSTVPFNPDPNVFQLSNPTFSGYNFFPPRFNVPNKRVAVEPFPVTEKAQVKGGVLQPMNQSALTALRVVFGNASYAVGQVVYVRSKLATTTTYAKEVLEIEGQKFFLLPEEEVLVVDSVPTQAPVTP